MDRSPKRSARDDRLELSTLEVERMSDGWRFWCDVWYLRTIEFRCASIRLNGVEIAGDGKWIQDDLPTEQPVIPPFPGAAPTSVDAALDVETRDSHQDN